MVNHSTPAHSSREPWGISALSNGDTQFLDDVIETDHIYQTQRPQLPPLQPIKTIWNNQSSQRQVPSLIKANTSSNQRKVNGSMYNERPHTSKVPALFPIQRQSNAYNGHYPFVQQTSTTQQPRASYASVAADCQSNQVNNRQQPAFNNLSQAQNYFGGNGNSLSMRQNVNLRLKENVSETCVLCVAEEVKLTTIEINPFHNRVFMKGLHMEEKKRLPKNRLTASC